MRTVICKLPLRSRFVEWIFSPVDSWCRRDSKVKIHWKLNQFTVISGLFAIITSSRLLRHWEKRNKSVVNFALVRQATNTLRISAWILQAKSVFSFSVQFGCAFKWCYAKSGFVLLPACTVYIHIHTMIQIYGHVKPQRHISRLNDRNRYKKIVLQSGNHRLTKKKKILTSAALHIKDRFIKATSKKKNERNTKLKRNDEAKWNDRHTQRKDIASMNTKTNAKTERSTTTRKSELYFGVGVLWETANILRFGGRMCIGFQCLKNTKTREKEHREDVQQTARCIDLHVVCTKHYHIEWKYAVRAKSNWK